MKKIIFISYLLPFTSCLLPAQGVWTQKADFGGGVRSGGVGFSIGTKGYVGTGVDSNSVLKNDFWEYNPSTNIWTQKADFGGTARSSAVGFSVGNKGYVGTGFDGNLLKDFWEYDVTNNAWTQRADFGGMPRSGAVGFSIGNFGYIGTGELSSGYTYDFWEYNPTNDMWIQKSTMAVGGGRYGAIGFSIGNKGYVGFGWDVTASQQVADLFEYDPVNDSWINFVVIGPSPRFFSVGFSIGDKGYIGTGVYSVLPFPNIPYPTFSDFWQYDTLNKTWSAKANFGGGIRGWAIGLSTNNKGYLGMGIDSAGVSKRDWWEFDTTTTSNTEINLQILVSCFPNPMHKYTYLKIISHRAVSSNLQLKIFDIYSNDVTNNFLITFFSKQFYYYIEKKNAISGIYFYQIIDIDYKKNLITGKFIVIKNDY